MWGQDKSHPPLFSFLPICAGHLSFAQIYLGWTWFINKEEDHRPAAVCLRLRAWGVLNTVWGALQSGDTRGKRQREYRREVVCVCVRQRKREREEVTSLVPGLGSNLRLEPVAVVQIHKGWVDCFWFSRKHVLAGVCTVVACFSCCVTDFNNWTFRTLFFFLSLFSSGASLRWEQFLTETFLFNVCRR